MKFLQTYKLFEKTSLLNIDVPYQVMKQLQRNYAISDNAKWKNLKYKKEVLPLLKNNKNNLIISICKIKLFILFSFDNEYYVESYSQTEKDDFGNEQWQRIDRVKTTLIDIVKKIERGCKSYYLISGNWNHEFANTRKIKKEETNFEIITNSFKVDFAESFTKIAKRIFGKKANIISDIIVNHLKNVNTNISDEEIREILFLNVDRAKDVDSLKRKQQEKDPYKLYNNVIKSDSLTIFNTFIIQYEDEYSDKYKEYLNIPILIERYSLEKVKTSFMYYIFSKKLMNL